MADRKGLTLIQMIVVLIIVGVMAAFAIPNFMNSIEKSKAQAAENNLLAISAAEQKYYEDNNQFCTTVASCGDSLPHLNTNLGLSITDTEFTAYSCSTVSTYYTCTATDTIFSPTIILTLQLGQAVTCTSGGAPNGKGCPG